MDASPSSAAGVGSGRGFAWLGRLAIALLCLALAVRLAIPEGDDPLAAILAAWRVSLASALGWLAAAWAVLGLSLFIGAVRFRTLLRGAGLEVGIGTLLRAYVVATFFNLVLPGAILGDVYRFLDARRGTGRGAQVLGIVVLERLLSLAALGGIALLVAPWIPSKSPHAALGWLPFLAGTCFVVPAAAALLPGLNRFLRKRLGWLGRISERAAQSADRALCAVAETAASPGVVVRALAFSLANQGLPVIAVMLLAVPLDSSVHWAWFAVIVPFVTLVSLLPISIGGTGVREILYVSLFGAVGMRPEAALALSLSMLAAALLWAAVGLLLFAAGRRRGDPALATQSASEPPQ